MAGRIFSVSFVADVTDLFPFFFCLASSYVLSDGWGRIFPLYIENLSYSLAHIFLPHTTFRSKTLDNRSYNVVKEVPVVLYLFLRPHCYLYPCKVISIYFALLFLVCDWFKLVLSRSYLT